MPSPDRALRERIAAATPADFPALALEVFAYQRRRNPTYARYLALIGWAERRPSTWAEIPSLPIGLWRSQDLRAGSWAPETSFVSSGTTGTDSSRQPVRDLEGYRAGCRRTFEAFFGPLDRWRLVALLPNYVARGNSGLVAMVDDFVARARPGSGFFLDRPGSLGLVLAESRRLGEPVLLWGVTFALLGLAARGSCALPPGSIVIETGGMKGQGPELTRDELHARLAAAFGVPVHSEYGMTELSAQAYRLADGRFHAPPPLRALARDLSDPFARLAPGRQGGLDLFDLTNLDTCGFVQTEDLGRVYRDATFEVLGRVDASVARGCNLLVTQAT